MEPYNDPYHYAELLLRYMRNEISVDEEKTLEFWLNQDERNREFFLQLQNNESLVGENDLFGQAEKDNAWRKIQRTIRPKPQKLWPRIMAAASILLFLSTVGYFMLRPNHVQQSTAKSFKNDVPPGHNQATLILANGKKITLTPGLNGELAKQGQTSIKATEGIILYQGQEGSEKVDENTLITAKGESSPYPLQLADGTRVWLNAESSLIFPTAFSGPERIVKLTGEGFFEVAHNSRKPFKVVTEKQTIEDIGTQFNVKSYSNDHLTATTLIEGAIRVVAADIIANPKLGEQVLSKDDFSTVRQANLKEVLAWKNGYFRFNNAPITDVMRELARWYSIDVIYQGNVTQERFTLKISRYKNISAVLRILEATKGVYFKVDGRRVTVLKKT
ncbi:MAG: FecR domain-containing protein [Bacteroidota bacterium]